MRLMLLTAATLCFAACSGCEEQKVEPATPPAAAADPAPAPAPTPPPAAVGAAPLRQPTPEELKAAVEQGERQVVDNNPMHRFESRAARINGRDVMLHPSRKLRALRGMDAPRATLAPAPAPDPAPAKAP